MYNMLRIIPDMNLDLCRVRMYKDYKSSTITEYILEGKNDSILVCVLKDEQGGHKHTFGMNLKLGLIYDCMEQCELVLNKDNLPLYFIFFFAL